MNIDWNMITSWAALISAFVAILALILQSRLTVFNSSIDLLMKLEDRFNSEPMLKVRKRAARALLSEENLDDVVEVLDFLEGVGLLLKKGALDPEMVWNDFSSWAIPYWTASKGYIASIRARDPHYWSNLEMLVERMNKMNRRRYGKSLYCPSTDEIKEFLSDESMLVER